MGRSLRKGPFVNEKLFRKVERARQVGDREPIKTWARACTIVPEFVGQNFLIHNGRTFIKLFVTEDMVGHKLGEFSPTRTFRGHGGRSAKETAAPGAAAAPAPAAKA
jgi:small subunit ribosomal protein S19